METILIYTLSDSLGVRYVGQTKNPKKRLYRHIYDCKNNGIKNKRCSWIKSLLNKNELPIMEIIDEVPINKWQFWEQYWISQFRTWGFKLVNDTDGGDGTYGRLVSDETKNKMSLTKKGITPKNFNIIKKASIKGKVVQYNLNGEKLNTYESCGYIENELKIPNVHYVIHKKRNSAGGYIWRLEGDELTNNEIEQIKYKHLKQEKKKIIQYNLDGVFIKEWDSVSDVKKTYQGISSVLSGSRKTAGGFKWGYK